MLVHVLEWSDWSRWGHKRRWRRCWAAGWTDKRQGSKDASHFTRDGKVHHFHINMTHSRHLLLITSHEDAVNFVNMWMFACWKVGDLPDAEVKPPENVLFVCKLNPVTTDEDLEIIFSRFGSIKWWDKRLFYCCISSNDSLTLVIVVKHCEWSLGLGTER